MNTVIVVVVIVTIFLLVIIFSFWYLAPGNKNNPVKYKNISDSQKNPENPGMVKNYVNISETSVSKQEPLPEKTPLNSNNILDWKSETEDSIEKLLNDKSDSEELSVLDQFSGEENSIESLDMGSISDNIGAVIESERGTLQELESELLFGGVDNKTGEDSNEPSENLEANPASLGSLENVSSGNEYLMGGPNEILGSRGDIETGELSGGAQSDDVSMAQGSPGASQNIGSPGVSGVIGSPGASQNIGSPGGSGVIGSPGASQNIGSPGGSGVIDPKDDVPDIEKGKSFNSGGTMDKEGPKNVIPSKTENALGSKNLSRKNSEMIVKPDRRLERSASIASQNSLISHKNTNNSKNKNTTENLEFNKKLQRCKAMPKSGNETDFDEIVPGKKSEFSSDEILKRNHSSEQKIQILIHNPDDGEKNNIKDFTRFKNKPEGSGTNFNEVDA